MEKKLPEFKPLPELGNVASNYMSAFNVGMNIYEALAYLQGYVQITYNSVDELIDDWNNFEKYVTENINQIANEKTQEILNQWLEDGTLNDMIAQNPLWNQKVNKSGDVMSGDLQFQENTGVYGTLHTGTKVNMISHSYTGTDGYTKIGDDNAQTVIYSENRPVWYDGAKNQDLLVEEDLTPQPNLLINSYFKVGIINQRGKTEYADQNSNTRTFYTIDRWIKRNIMTTVQVLSKSIKIINNNAENDSGVGLNQTLLRFGQLYGKKLTCTINVKSIDGLWGFGICAADEPRLSTLPIGVPNHEWFIIDKPGLHTVTLDMPERSPINPNTEDPYKYFNLTIYGNNGGSFPIPKGQYIEFDMVKVEIGENYTGMEAWNFAKELNKCLPYYELLNGSWQNQYVFRTDEFGVGVFVPCYPKRTIPSLEIHHDSGQEQDVVLFNYTSSSSPKNLNYENYKQCNYNGYNGVNIWFNQPSTHISGSGTAVFSQYFALNAEEF